MGSDRGRPKGFAFGFLHPVLRFTREQVVQDFSPSGLEFLRLKHSPGFDILDFEGDQGQIVITYSGQLSGKLTVWLGSGSTGHRGAQSVHGESADGEEGEEDFGEHDDRNCREKEQITTAPGLKFGRLERGTGVSCAAAEETGKYTSTVL